MAERPEETAPDVSVIIPTFNRREPLREAVMSLFRQTYRKDGYETIIVDNSSTDGTDRMIEEMSREAPCALRYFRKENKGPGPARNLGIRHAKGRILAFTDSDCAASPEWIEKGVEVFSSDDIAFVSGKILPKPGMPITFFSPFHYVLEEHPIYPSNNIFYRRDIVENLGGFDERFDYPSGGEDADLAWRVKRRGWKNVFAGDLVIYHEVHRYSLFDIVFREIWRWRKDPFIVKEIPELRERLFYLGYFHTERMPFFCLAVVGGIVGVLLGEGACALMLIPYGYHLVRLYDGDFMTPRQVPKGLVKVGITVVQDMVRAFTFTYGSIRYRSLLL